MVEIDVSRDQLITIAQAARMLPKKPSPASIWRWHARGVHGIRLPTVVVGRRRFTTDQAFQQFVRLVTEAANRTEKEQRQDQSESVRKELDTHGLL